MKKIKITLGEKVDTFFKRNPYFRGFVKVVISLFILYWIYKFDLTPMKYVEQSDKAMYLLSISWVVLLKLFVSMLAIYYNMPRAKNNKSKNLSANSQMSLVS